MHSITPLFRSLQLRSLSAATSSVFSAHPHARCFTAASNEGSIPNSGTKRVLTGYHFRKPEGVLEVTFRPAKFRPAGAKGIYHRLTTEGTVRLTMCAASGPPMNSAPNNMASPYPIYDFVNKIFVDITALDIVTIVQSPISNPVRCFTFLLAPNSQLTRSINTNKSNSQIVVAYSDVSVRGGRPVSRRLDVTPAAPVASASPIGDKTPQAAARPPAPAPILLTLTNDTLSFNVTLAQQEMYLLRNLLGLSIPHLTGWQYQLMPSSFDPAFNLAAPSKGDGGDAALFEGEEELVALPQTDIPSQSTQPPPLTPPPQQSRYPHRGQEQPAYPSRGAPAYRRQ